MSDLPRSTSGLSAAEFARDLVHQAGEVLLSRFRTEKQVEEKGRGNIVTDVDRQVEEMVVSRLKQEYPGFGILAEESGQRGGDSPYTWLVDPLDGTRNYASGVPIFAVSVALAKGDEVVLGATYDPTRRELFRAEKGKGAFANDAPMAVSRRATVQASVIGLDMGYDDDMGHYVFGLLDALWPGVQAIRILGSAALGLAYVAAGRIDIYVHHLLSPWDIAAGIRMGQEAGGTVTNRDNQPIRITKDQSIIVANQALHADFLQRTQGLKWRGIRD